ncbi:helix-turn-helix domain-containing protein [Streptomyces canus]|uniref:PucR family transcriptional regulator n=1 Tax=Streptomyces canus TaxID=58343 RepID=UPI0034019549
MVTVLGEGAAHAQSVAGVELLDDPEATGCLPSAQFLLAVGLDPAHHLASEAALRTAAGHQSVLAVKCALPAPDEFVARAVELGVTVVAVNPHVPWTRIQQMVATLLEAGSGDSGGGDRRFGSDLFTLANAVAAIVGGAVAIMDTRRVLLAYSNLPDQPIDETRRRAILSRQVPADAVADHLDKELWGGDVVVRHHRQGDLPRLAVAIRAGQDVLGSLWVASTDTSRPIGEYAATLHEAAAVAALRMLALRRQDAEDQDRRSHALRSALETGAIVDRRTVIRFPGVLLGLTERAVPHAAVDETDSDWRLQSDLMRMLDLITLDGRSLGYDPVATVIGNRLYSLVPTVTPAAVSVENLLDHLMDRAHRSLDRAYLLVSSGDISSPIHLSEAARDIDVALDHLNDERAAPGVYRMQDLHSALVLRRLLATVRDRADLRTGSAERIAAHDADHGTDYLATLGAYLRHFGDVVPASEELHIHQNTLRQRLRKAERTFGLALQDPGRRLLLSSKSPRWESS